MMEGLYHLTQEMGDAVTSRLRQENSQAHDLETLENRLHDLRNIARKHQVGPNNLISVLEDLRARSQLCQNLTGEIEDLARQTQTLYDEYMNLARALSARRTIAAENLNELVNEVLPQLKLPHAHFRTRLTPGSGGQSTRSGHESVVFEVAPNGGDHYGLLHEVASGGERARILLALKRALKKTSQQTLMIFDEIDSGVSGAVSTRMGYCLQELSQHVQVFAITHSAQIASLAHHHILIEKNQDHKGAITQAKFLTGETRLHEVARMLAGNTITNEALAAAHRLMTDEQESNSLRA
jgi:DNA repair protein RecN (Recombination protein N)